MEKIWIGLSALALLGCSKSGAVEDPKAAEPQAEEKDESALSESNDGSDAIVAALPTSLTCMEGEECLPRPSFTKATCEGRFPGMAIKMFEEGSPWRRLYVQAENLEPSNTHGGKITEPLVNGEEVLLLRRHAGGPDGMTVSGSDVDVLRWDGSCATLPYEYLAEQPPGAVTNATIVWKYLDDTMAEALRSDENIEAERSKHGEICRSSPDSGECDAATKKLSAAIVAAVRGGIQLPEPSLLPEWNIQE